MSGATATLGCPPNVSAAKPAQARVPVPLKPVPVRLFQQPFQPIWKEHRLIGLSGFGPPVCPNFCRLKRLRKKYFLLSSRAQRGICFFANPTKKADSSGKIRPRNDKIGVFPQPANPVPVGQTAKVNCAGEPAQGLRG